MRAICDCCGVFIGFDHKQRAVQLGSGNRYRTMVLCVRCFDVVERAVDDLIAAPGNVARMAATNGR